MNAAGRWIGQLSGMALRLLPTLPYARPAPEDSAAPAVEARELGASARPGSPAAFSGVSFTVRRGTRVALTGPNGSGKSTLLRVLAGLAPATRGEIAVLGARPRTGRPKVAFLSQRPDFTAPFPMSLRRLVRTGTYAHHGWFEECHHGDEAVDRALAMMGLSELAERQVHTLSGGQLQRALLARAAVQGAELLLLDEPYAALDDASRSLVDAHLFSPDAAFTVLMATHETTGLPRFNQVLELGRDGLSVRDGKEAHGG